ncbi:MAG: hypothetical protein GY715_05465 [Planctomycetes bacterium]|nr:hypothetical protein [Planctomycetota bacterium]
MLDHAGGVWIGIWKQARGVTVHWAVDPPFDLARVRRQKDVPAWAKSELPSTVPPDRKLPHRRWVVGTGWPLPAMKSTLDPALGSMFADPRVNWGIRLPKTQAVYAGQALPRALPLLPIWPGFLLDSLLYTVFWLVALPMWGIIRRRVRRHYGHCPACRRDLLHDLAAGCPCGWPARRRRRGDRAPETGPVAPPAAAPAFATAAPGARTTPGPSGRRSTWMRSAAVVLIIALATNLLATWGCALTMQPTRWIVPPAWASRLTGTAVTPFPAAPPPTTLHRDEDLVISRWADPGITVSQSAGRPPDDVRRLDEQVPAWLESEARAVDFPGDRWIIDVGWPAHSMRARVDVDRSSGAEIVDVQGALSLPGPASNAYWTSVPRVLPLIPIWSGLAFNTLVFATAWLLVLLVPRQVRRLVRRRFGHCPPCGYDLNGVFAPGCPECGWRRRPSS